MPSRDCPFRVLPNLIVVAVAALLFAGLAATPVRATGTSPASAVSHGRVSIAWSRDAHRADIDLIGSWPTTAAWRIEVRGSGSASGHMVQLDLVPLDECLGGTIADRVLVRGSWRTTRVVAIPCTFSPAGAVVALRDGSIGLIVSSAAIVLPRNGNSRLHVRLTFERAQTHVSIRGAVRVASLPFVLGPWLLTPWAWV